MEIRDILESSHYHHFIKDILAQFGDQMKRLWSVFSLVIVFLSTTCIFSYLWLLAKHLYLYPLEYFCLLIIGILESSILVFIFYHPSAQYIYNNFSFETKIDVIVPWSPTLLQWFTNVVATTCSMPRPTMLQASCLLSPCNSTPFYSCAMISKRRDQTKCFALIVL